MRQNLKALKRQQENIIQQISDRAAEGRPRLTALDDTLDRLEVERQSLEAEIAAFSSEGPDMTAKVEALRQRYNAEQTELQMRRFVNIARDGKDETAKQMLMPVVRQMIQKVVIGPAPGHQPATLQVHGLIASILAQMDVMDRMERQFMVSAQRDFEARVVSGELDTEAKRKKLLDAYIEELRSKYPEWADLQVSVVAGAGFEPAAFRL